VTDVPKLNSITQFFDVTTAGSYTFSFDYYAPNNGQANPLDGFVTVLSGLQVIDKIDIDAVSDGWQTFTDTLSFNHTGLHDVSFIFSVPGNFNKFGKQNKNVQYAADLIVSNVSLVSSVPEPATWGMMLLGFFGLGAMVRRRSTAAAAIA
jgi:PEP-CTERM motif